MELDELRVNEILRDEIDAAASVQELQDLRESYDLVLSLLRKRAVDGKRSTYLALEGSGQPRWVKSSKKIDDIGLATNLLEQSFQSAISRTDKRLNAVRQWLPTSAQPVMLDDYLTPKGEQALKERLKRPNRWKPPKE